MIGGKAASAGSIGRASVWGTGKEKRREKCQRGDGKRFSSVGDDESLMVNMVENEVS